MGLKGILCLVRDEQGRGGPYGEPIPDARREAVPGVRTCVHCQSERDGSRAPAGFNRRGSKDSQLR